MLIVFGGLTSALVSKSVLLGRGRGIGRLIVGLMEGDPVYWSILGGVVVIGLAWYLIKRRMSTEE